jgi:glycerate 2-kinase
MGPDQTTLENALRVIHDYDLASRLPKRVVQYLQSCGSKGETPKAFPRNTYFQLNTLPDSCAYAKEIAENMGLPVMILTTFIEGESKEVGSLFASIAREIQCYHRPIAPPCVVLSAGEATTTILDNKSIKGHGGPSQEMAISFALGAQKSKGACMLSIDTEGTDGTTLAAGGITDSKSAAEASNHGIDLFDALRGHASNEALTEIGNCVITGNTGTNVCDFNIMYVPALHE